MLLAVKTAQAVKDAPARAMVELAESYLKVRRQGDTLPIFGAGGTASKSGCCS
jgi:hypothetical protein